jgi:hypothetical protein
LQWLEFPTRIAAQSPPLGRARCPLKAVGRPEKAFENCFCTDVRTVSPHTVPLEIERYDYTTLKTKMPHVGPTNLENCIHGSIFVPVPPPCFLVLVPHFAAVLLLSTSRYAPPTTTPPTPSINVAASPSLGRPSHLDRTERDICILKALRSVLAAAARM